MGADFIAVFAALGVMGIIIAAIVQILINSVALWFVVNHMMGEQDSKEPFKKCIICTLLLFGVIVLAVVVLILNIPWVSFLGFWAILALGPKAVVEGTFERTEGSGKILILFYFTNMILGWGLQYFTKDYVAKAKKAVDAKAEEKYEKSRFKAVMLPLPEPLANRDLKDNLLKDGNFKTDKVWYKNSQNDYINDELLTKGGDLIDKANVYKIDDNFAMMSTGNYTVWSRYAKPIKIKGADFNPDGYIGVSQYLSRSDVSQMPKLVLAMDVWVSEENISPDILTGMQAPVHVELEYVDYNGNDQIWRHCFVIYEPPDALKSPHIQVVEKEKWTHVVFDLADPKMLVAPYKTEALPKIHTIYSINIFGNGKDFKGAVGNVYLGASDPGEAAGNAVSDLLGDGSSPAPEEAKDKAKTAPASTTNSPTPTQAGGEMPDFFPGKKEETKQKPPAPAPAEYTPAPALTPQPAEQIAAQKPPDKAAAPVPDAAIGDSVTWSNGEKWTGVKILEVKYNPKDVKFYANIEAGKNSQPANKVKSGWYQGFTEITFSDPSPVYHILWHSSVKTQMGEFWSWVGVKRIWVEPKTNRHGVEIITSAKSLPKEKVKSGSFYFFEAIKHAPKL